MVYDLSNSLIIGQGVTAQYTARYLLGRGNQIQIYSLKPNRLENDLAQFYTQNPAGYSLVWLSPGIPPSDPLYEKVDNTVPWILDIDYFLSTCQVPAILVTGTNGKSTVTRYIQAMLSAHDVNAGCYGNYQPGLLTADWSDLQWAIIELSSYQLYWLQTKQQSAASVLLAIEHDHIQWHGSYENYKEAKYKIAKMSNLCIDHQGKFGQSYQSRANELILENYYTQQEAENIAAAELVLKKLGFKQPIPKNLPILPYRQSTLKLAGNIIINDSKSTNVASTLSALKIVQSRYAHLPILLILAGVSKVRSHEAICQALSSGTKVVVLGDDFQDMNYLIKGRYSSLAALKSDIVDFKGVVLFSPAGASCDWYSCYNARGDAFNRWVKSIWES